MVAGIVAMGMVGSVVNGLGDPLMMVFFADSLKALSDTSDALKTMERVAVMMVIVGGVLHVAASIQTARSAGRFSMMSVMGLPLSLAARLSTGSAGSVILRHL